MNAAALDSLSLVGVSHSSAPLAVREKLSIPAEEAKGFLAELRDRQVAREALVLSTCNRTELYCLSDHPEEVLDKAAGRSGKPGVRDLFYLKRGRETIKHSFAVASGLDSMILGEPEIFGQMKKAYAYARDNGFTGPHLTKLFESTFTVAKKIRTDTAISRQSVSAPAICAQLAGRIFGDLGECRVLCVGAGTIIETTLEYFTSHDLHSLFIANRTLQKAQKLAERYEAQTLAYEDIIEHLHRFDVVITATQAVLPVIGKGSLEHAFKRRKRRPIAIFDLAVPRDVEPEAAEIEDLFLYTIDDIGKLANTNMEKRRTAVNAAQTHIAQATEDLVSWYESRETVDVIKELRQRLDRIQGKEIELALRAIDRGAEPAEALRKLAHRLTNRLGNDPLKYISSRHAQSEFVDELGGWYEDDEQDTRPGS